MSAETLPLTGIKVLDLTRVRAGPTAVRQLADWGADVIKIERPSVAETLGGPRHGPDFLNLHRNKRSMTLDLKASAGREIFLELCSGADVVVENYRPDVKTRLGIDYASASAVNPRLIYGSISGFGQDGPYVERAGVDQIAQGMGGLMSITGLPGQGPVRVGIPIADLSAGMLLAQGILLALIERQRSGVGQWVHTSLLEAQIQMLDFQASRWLVDGDVAGQAGNDHPTSIPTGVFETADGHINIAAAGDHIYARLCRAIDAEHLIDHEDYRSGGQRSKNRAALNAEIAAYIKQQPSAHWIEVLNAASVPTGPINSIDQTFDDPQVHHLEMARPMDHPVLGEVQLVGQAINLGRTEEPARMRPTPEQGEHTDDILRELGRDEAAIAALRADDVV